jgi:hypothetical protein
MQWSVEGRWCAYQGICITQQLAIPEDLRKCAAVPNTQITTANLCKYIHMVKSPTQHEKEGPCNFFSPRLDLGRHRTHTTHRTFFSTRAWVSRVRAGEKGGARGGARIPGMPSNPLWTSSASLTAQPVLHLQSPHLVCRLAIASSTMAAGRWTIVCCRCSKPLRHSREVGRLTQSRDD